MDKYTVDLDKVLNDFEYSELTESQTNISPHKAPLSTPKHSINNVFHSLNEYLNTDIKSPTTSVTEISDIETLPVIRKDKNNIASIENIFKSLTKDDVDIVNNLEENIIESVENNDIETEIVNNDLKTEIVNNDIEINNECIQEEIKIEEKIEKADPIKFGDIELSDTELENELAELEQEYDKDLKTELDEIETDVNNEKEIVNNESDENISEKIDNSPPIEENQERRESIRPNSLDLTSETENPTINLIGAPGSTPYNNFYLKLPETSSPVINEPEVTDLTPKTSNNEVGDRSESGNLTSFSPTLSDTSTYENSQSDSATSDTGNDTSLDDNELANQGRIQEESQPENVNVEGDPNPDVSWLGKTAPFWTPDSDALSCLHCNQKFTVIKRRHHCRACGLVLCSKCCNMKCKLEYMENTEARVCLKCYNVLVSCNNTESDNVQEAERKVLRPGNPMDYCSTVPPHEQVSGTAQPPPAVMVPVGVLKRQGSAKSRSSKSVIFMDGIRPGCDLTELDDDFNYKSSSVATSSCASGSNGNTTPNNNNYKSHVLGRVNRNLPKVDKVTGCYIPSEIDMLPPIVTVVKSDIFYAECSNNQTIVDMLKNETISFAIQTNLHVQLAIINMDCCINKLAWCFSTEGMIAVGQDEIIILLEFIDNEKTVPKDIFLHLNQIYNDAVKGTSIPEMGISIHSTPNFLESKNHVGFLYIKPTFQCIQNVLIPKEPYLIGILIHRWETPWAKIFPLRLLLRLGAEYRYYPSPIISTRHRESVYVEIGHTIINLLADFRNFSYSLPVIRGLTIHMEDKKSVVSIPRNRYEQIMRALNNASDHILALAAAFNPSADSHLVCIQDTHGNNENNYTTHAINIHNKPRKVTGASFIVLNGALKSSSGLTAKSSIIEDGLMIQIPAEQMQKLRNALRNMKDFKILCGPVNTQSDESVSIIWVENDVNFNIGVTSPIDNMSLNGVPSIRVHNGRDFPCNSGNKMIRWTEVFIIQNGEESVRTTAEPIDVSRISEAISKATSQALVKYLDLLATNSQTKIAIRVNLNIENVSYLAGSNGTKLPPIYMKSLDNELIPVLHRISAGFSENVTVSLELMFHILNC